MLEQKTAKLAAAKFLVPAKEQLVEDSRNGEAAHPEDPEIKMRIVKAEYALFALKQVIKSTEQQIATIKADIAAYGGKAQEITDRLNVVVTRLKKNIELCRLAKVC